VLFAGRHAERGGRIALKAEKQGLKPLIPSGDVAILPHSRGKNKTDKNTGFHALTMR